MYYVLRASIGHRYSFGIPHVYRLVYRFAAETMVLQSKNQWFYFFKTSGLGCLGHLLTKKKKYREE